MPGDAGMFLVLYGTIHTWAMLSLRAYSRILLDGTYYIITISTAGCKSNTIFFLLK